MADDPGIIKTPEWDEENSRFVQASLVHQHLEQLLSQGDFDGAVKLYMREGGESGDSLVQRFAGDKDMSMRLANVLYRARDFARAAQVCRNLGEHGRAAELFDRCGNHQLAAECYYRTDDLENAADRFEKAGFSARAAELFLEAGDRFRAAVSFERSGDAFAAGQQYFTCRHDQKAMEQLQKVPPGSRKELKALGMLATIMVRQGQPEMALPRLREMAQSHEPGPDNLELFFRLGELEYDHGELDAAREVFEKIAEIDSEFADVSAKLLLCSTGNDGEDDGLEIPIPAEDEEPPPEVIKAQVCDPSEDIPELPPLAEPEGRAMSVTLVIPEVDQLAEYPLLADLSLQDVRSLFAMSEAREHAAGETILEAGSPSPGLFLIRTGRVEVHVETGADREMTVLDLGEREHFGEAVLLGDEFPLGRVESIEPTTLWFIPRERFLSVVQRSPEVERDVYRALINCMHTNLKQVTRRLLESGE